MKEFIKRIEKGIEIKKIKTADFKLISLVNELGLEQEQIELICDYIEYCNTSLDEETIYAASNGDIRYVYSDELEERIEEYLEKYNLPSFIRINWKDTLSTFVKENNATSRYEIIKVDNNKYLEFYY